MTERIDHAALADLALQAGRESAGKAKSAARTGFPSDADAHGKKAHGCWMQAQAEAALALVEQQRVANFIALSALPGFSTTPDMWAEIQEALGLS